jgi:hypothetical protein
MNRLLIILFLVGVADCQITTSSDTASTAFLTVLSPISALPVYLDSLQIGRTPLENCKITTGTHRLVVVSSYGMAWNADNYVQTFTAGPGQKLEFNAVLVPSLLLNTIPYGAKVYINGQLLGTTPLRIQTPALTARIEMEGYESRDILLESLKGPAHVVPLIPNANWLSTHQKQKHDHQRTIKWRKRLMYGSLALAAVTGFTTARFRSRGDDAYAGYMSTAIPADMDRFYAKSRKYDKYAGVSYVLFETGFVMTVYFFLSSRQ